MRLGIYAAAMATACFTAAGNTAVLEEGITTPASPRLSEIFTNIPSASAFQIEIAPGFTFNQVDVISSYNGQFYQSGSGTQGSLDSIFGNPECYIIGSGTCSQREGYQNYSVLVNGRVDGNIARFAFRTRLTGPMRVEREDIVNIEQAPWMVIAFVNGAQPVGYRITELTSGAIPEPTTWAMLIAGVGATGYRLRRRPTRRKACLA